MEADTSFSKRLRDLESAGLRTRTVYAEVPPTFAVSAAQRLVAQRYPIASRG